MSSTNGLDPYLNSHMAGSVGARELIKKSMSANTGTPCGDFLRTLLRDVEDDTGTLEGVMRRCGVAKRPLKLAGGWIVEKITRLGFNERLTGSADVSRLLELESLSLGVTGKLGVWTALKEIAAKDSRLGEIDFDRLIARARAQLTGIERHRLEAAARAFTSARK